MTRRLFFIGFLLSISLFLRVFNLSSVPNGLYWDEIDSGYQAFSLLQTGKDYFGNAFPFFFHSLADYRTPVYLYSAVPLIKVFGFTALGIRLTSVVWGSVGVLAMYVLAQRLFKTGAIAAVLMAVSMWSVQYSRVAWEPLSMVTCLTIASAAWLRNQKPLWFFISMLFFGLSLASYSTAKLFVPLWMICIFWSHRPKKITLLGLGIFLVFACPIYLDALTGKSGSRLHDIAVYTDPTVRGAVDQKRLETRVGIEDEKRVGSSPTLIDKFSYNKPEEWLSQMTKNYLSAFSTDFLFIRGDQQLRHSPSTESIGMFFAIESVALVIGLAAILKASKSKKIFIGSWILLAPIAASLTRDGWAHASRLILLLPVLIILISLGIKQLSKSKILLSLYLLIFVILVGNTYYFYFSRYKLESTIPFQWGFDKAVELGINEQNNYDQVIIDMEGDSALMAYLYQTKMSPKAFQSQLPLKYTEIAEGVPGIVFGKIILMPPGSRQWRDIKLTKKSLVILSHKAASAESYGHKIKRIDYASGNPAFYVFSRP